MDDMYNFVIGKAILEPRGEQICRPGKPNYLKVSFLAEPEYQFDFKTGKKTDTILGYRCIQCGMLNYYNNFIKDSLDPEEQEKHKNNLFRCEICKRWLKVAAYNPGDPRQENLPKDMDIINVSYLKTQPHKKNQSSEENIDE